VGSVSISGSVYYRKSVVLMPNLSPCLQLNFYYYLIQLHEIIHIVCTQQICRGQRNAIGACGESMAS
jgi:hypothetical protein